MKITYKNYILKSEDTAKTRFTLSVKTKIEHYKNLKGTGKFYDGIKTLGYSFTLEGAIRYIIELELANKDITVTLKEYIKLYKKEVEKVTDILKS